MLIAARDPLRCDDEPLRKLSACKIDIVGIDAALFVEKIRFYATAQNAFLRDSTKFSFVLLRPKEPQENHT